MMKNGTRVIYAAALLRTIASAISGFAIEVFVRFSGASDIGISLLSAIPSITYTLAALFLSGLADKLGRRVALLISSVFSFIATIAYIGLFVGVGNLSVLLTAVISIASIEGMFAAWFWPVLQARLGEGTREKGPQIRMYNLSWNLGIILGNTLVAGYSGIAVEFALLFPIILQVLVGTLVINGAIVGLLWGKLGKDHMVLARRAIVVASPKRFPAGIPLSVGVVFMALFAFAFNIGGILTNLFNQVTAVSAGATVAANLLPWLPVIDTTRQMAQLAASGFYKVAKPTLNDITRIVTGMSVLALLSGSASTLLTQGGIVILVLVLGMHGVFSGILYNATMQIILHDAPANQRGRFQGLYEAVLGLGFFAGPVVAGVISEANGYLTSYTVLAGISFVATGILASAQVGIAERFYLRGGIIAPAKARRFPVAIKASIAIAILWIGLRVILGTLATYGGISMVLLGTAVACVVLLKPRSDHMQAFDHFRSPRPHVPAACMPYSKAGYYALTPAPLEVFPLVPL